MIEWDKPKAYYCKSSDGQYSVAKFYQADVPGYMAFRLNTGAMSTRLSGRLDSGKEAKRVCEEDAQARIGEYSPETVEA